MTSPQQPPERPNGSFVKHTRTGFDQRPMVSILVREDDPRNPDTPQRWRSVEGRSGWFTWGQLHATGTVEPLFTSAEVAAAATSRVLAQAPRTDHDRPARLTAAREQPNDPATRDRWDTHRAARPEPGQTSNPPSTSASAPPQPGHSPAARDLGGPRR